MTATTARAAECWSLMLAAARAGDPLAVPVATDYAQEPPA